MTRTFLTTTALCALGQAIALVPAEASCTLSAQPNQYTCQGATTTTQQILGPASTTVQTSPGYGVTVTGAPTGIAALVIWGDGLKTYIDTNASMIDTSGTSNTIGGLQIVMGRDLPGNPASVYLRSNGDFYTSSTALSLTGLGGAPESGFLDVELTGTLRSTKREGLAFFAPGQGGTVTVNNVSGQTNGIAYSVGSNGTNEAPVLQNMVLNTNGLVQGRTGFGINTGTSGGNGGMAPNVLNIINVAATSVVEGGSGAISVGGRPLNNPLHVDNQTLINNDGVIRNLAATSNTRAIYGYESGRVAITNRNLILGTVELGDLADTFDNRGTWNTANGANDFGAGADKVDNRGTVIAASSSSLAETTSFNGLETFTNRGLLAMGDGGTQDVTRTSGDYVGSIGTVTMDTYLGADDSPTDLFVIGGNASGSTALAISNAGGPGALTTGDGIKVVKVDGTSTSDAFHLIQTLTAGAYDYNLFYGGVADPNDQDWYLRSVGLSGSTQTALPYADTLTNFAEATLGTMQQRTGNRTWPNGAPPETIWCKDPARNYRCTPTGEQNASYADGGPVIYGQGAWGRIGGQYASYDPKSGSAYTQSLGFLQAGYEGVAYESGAGDMTVGAFATIGTSRSDIDVSNDPVTRAARSGKITSTGYGLGGNLTWLGRSGLYADAVGQFTWYQSDLSNKTGGGNAGWSSVLSLEVGKRFEIGSGWAVVPQAQLAWSHVDFDSFTDINGARVAIGDGDGLKGRVGVRVENLASWKNDQGKTDRLQLYGIANLSYQFINGTSVKVATSSFTQQNRRLWGKVGLGGTYVWNDKWSAYGEAGYGTALSSGAGDNYAVKGTAGLRYIW
ncbi:autotransporter outer membrane beta-barrel domain-containing protein [Labrys sp. KNU-23]|uniref:autotransporter family protein n=1 Tax=Labrys sp. KNU-23 TaxID=2789216 RepID=UPI0011EFD5C6|nr:autotransporter outer membrane beta-barrel domain-containing protein [Labrys sp. KNU-23]QEN84982.1 autotransporter outer membrane beta-barrel domain-containing protein [Labrys sp. KNU-23]